MPEPRHLRNAPITEAILDFRVKARPEFHPRELSALKELLTGRFPKVNERHAFQATFGMLKGKGQPPVLEEKGLQGYFFKSEDEKTIAQFRVDGFTFNRLQPYTSWLELFPQAIGLWQLYIETAKPVIAKRLALRYINRIPMPLGPFEIETYLRTAPIIPPELPQNVSAFLSRVTIRDPATGVSAHISQALEIDAQTQRPSVILDIDAFKEGDFASDDPAIQNTFETLHSLKNNIFFNSLTEECLRQFE